MKYIQPKKRYSHLLIAITLCLAGTTSLTHAAQGSPESTKEFLSDPSRVGSLTGTILGGALTAHPAGTVVGSILGFFVGKQSMFESPEKQRLAQSSYAQRSIIPISTEATEQPILTLDTSTPEAGEILQTQTDIIDKEFQALSPLQQITAYCYGNQSSAINPTLQSMCYYYSG